QDIGLAVSIPPEPGQLSLFGSGVMRDRSVFEEDSDFTFVPKGTETESDFKRWKFRGPWLAGMTEGEFTQYIKKRIRNRRQEFRGFLKKKLAAEMSKGPEQSAFDVVVETAKDVSAEIITDEQLTEYI